MATADEVVQRLKESRPPATDSFTYLTIIEQSLSPEILPALEEILDDAELTGDIGWDLVEMLIAVPGSQECLERIARLGNPREVILKVLEVMERTSDPVDGEDDADADADKNFVTLTGMLGILHGRLKVKAPSRFLRNTLDTVLRAYHPTSATATAAVIDLVRSLSGRKRPPLPTRQSSTTLDTPFQDSDPAKSAPDPEAEQEDRATEPALMARLLQCFITCIVEAYSNANSLEWASRLLEYTFPERIVPGRPTMMRAFKEIDEFRARDALIGQLVAVAGDLGLSDISSATMKRAFEGPIFRDPLLPDDDGQNAKDIELSTGGFICITAYRMFAKDVFDADYDIASMAVFPDHYALLKRCLDDKAEDTVQNLFAGNSGTFEALLVIAMYLFGHDLVAPDSSAAAEFMSYHHQLTLISLFHPALRVRNAATVLAGQILHADPDEDDRLAILEDLLENCMFASLQACAVTWLREEIIAAGKAGSHSRFTSTDCFTNLQYTLFPDLRHLSAADTDALLEFWSQNAPFHLTVANFALFLFGSKAYRELVPAGMAAAVELRYVEPLVQAAKALTAATEKAEVDGAGGEGEMLMQLGILTDTLGRVPL